jgi:hypothetical protein
MGKIAFHEKSQMVTTHFDKIKTILFSGSFRIRQNGKKFSTKNLEISLKSLLQFRFRRRENESRRFSVPFGELYITRPGFSSPKKSIFSTAIEI